MFIGFLLVPIMSLAAEPSVTRRDGFLLIWESIARPAYESRAEFSDISDGDIGAEVITYAKTRGILDDAMSFHPNDPLIFSDAILWLYRTRNVRELPDMQRNDLSSMIEQYPIVGLGREMSRPIERMSDLIAIIRTLDEMLAKEIHEASFYADDFHGNGTAFGETFDMNVITAAHRSFPHNTLVKVTNIDNGKELIVRINDRGPYIDGRDMDLSRAAFLELAPEGQGVLRATFERLGDKDLVNRCEKTPRRYQKRITGKIHFFRGVPRKFTVGEELVLQSNRPFVIHAITFPDGQKIRIQDFVLPKEKYRFSPSDIGLHLIEVGDAAGKRREMQIDVSACLLPK